MKTDRLYKKCPFCCGSEELGKKMYAMARETDWMPGVGLDPALREFKCSECGGVFYMVVVEAELAMVD